MKMKKLLSLLLALTLALGAAPARAAEAPSLEVTDEGALLTLEMTGLDGAYCGIQFTVTLSAAADASFEVDDALFRSHPSLYSTYVREGASVTVYIVAKSPLNEGERLRLGSLHTEAGPSAVSDIKLLTLEDLETFGSGGLTELPGTPASPGTPATPNVPYPPSSDSGRPSAQESASYRIEVPEEPENGVLQVSAARAEAGETVTVTAIPAEGYVLDTLSVLTEGGGSVPLIPQGDGTYRFTMPAATVTVRASFAAAPQDAIVLPFLDVPMNMWYYDAIAYAYEAGLMGGVSASTFAPESFTTRGQIVTILHRLEGEPPALDRGGFTDVPDGQWYTAAVDWAAEEGIVDGYGDGSFRPDDNVTREQLAAILFRCARYLGTPETAPGDLTAFGDCDKVSPWALEAMAWANGCGLINGKNGGLLDPTGNATRAEVATILMRFCENVIK